MIMIIKITGIKFSFSDNLIIPIISAVLSMQIVAVTDRLIHLDNLNFLVETIIFACLTLVLYIVIQKLIYRLTEDRLELELR